MFSTGQFVTCAPLKINKGQLTMARRFVSNRNETVRMFDSNFLEWFSHIHPATPIVLFMPLVTYLVWASWSMNGLAMTEVALLFVFGVFLWTFLEYILHRFIFHYVPKSKWGKRLHFVMHGVHHDYPSDATRLVMAPGISLPLGAFFYLVFWFVFSSNVNAIFAGTMFGYVCYDTIHYATHHFKLNRGIGKWLRQYHMRHHFQDETTRYGVSTPLWDYVFGTIGRRQK